MRIALASTLSAPVRRETGGSVESLVWLLARELDRLGHDVTVFGCAGSECAGKFIATMPGPYGAKGTFDDWQLCEWVNLSRAVEQADEFDVIHTHAYLWGLPLGPLSQTPMVHTLHIVPDENNALLWRRYPNARVTALSQHQWSEFPDLKPAAIIPHGVDDSEFTLCGTPGDYVLYLGRFVSGKGPLHAIAAAEALGLRLVLAGPENPYFREHIRPRVNGRQVEYAGFVSGSARDKLLGGARALLYPIQHPEAFGLVLVEAMMCGTPVAAVRLGAVPEIVEEGVTGCMADGMGDFTTAVLRSLELDRRRVRQRAGQRFSAGQMASAHLRLYEGLTQGRRG
jgi:glycosyltransferase involved in cell wall biosynthesis